MLLMSYVIIAKSSTYAMVVILHLKVITLESSASYLRRGNKNMIELCGLSVSP